MNYDHGQAKSIKTLFVQSMIVCVCVHAYVRACVACMRACGARLLSV